MAVPVDRGGTPQKAEGGLTAVAVPPPSGVTPAEGDLDVIVVETAGNDTPDIPTSGGGTWTQLLTVSTGGSASSTRLTVFWRIFPSGGSDPEVRSAPALGNHMVAFRTLIQAGTFDPAAPFDTIGPEGEKATGTEGTSDSSFSWTPGGSVATTGPDRLVLLALTNHVDTSTAISPHPTSTEAGLTSRANRATYNTTQGNGGGVSLTEWARLAAGGFGTFSATMGDGVSSTKAYAVFAVNPPPTTPSDSGTNTSSVSHEGIERIADVTDHSSAASQTGAEATADAGENVSAAAHAGDEAEADSGSNVSSSQQAVVDETLAETGDETSVADHTGQGSTADVGDHASVADPHGAGTLRDDGDVIAVAIFDALEAEAATGDTVSAALHELAETRADAGDVHAVAGHFAVEVIRDESTLTTVAVVVGSEQRFEVGDLVTEALHESADAIVEPGDTSSTASFTAVWRRVDLGLSGTAYDETGDFVQPGTEVLIFRDDTNELVAAVVANAAGEWSITVNPGPTYWISGWKSGSPNTFGRTDKGIEPEEITLETGT